MSFTTRHPVREYAGGSVGGILRKGGSNGSSSATNIVNAGESRKVDLLVFGYACKVFRDDDKAREIDQGKHLIPWMGDVGLKIDRYDVRGALSDLTQYEPPPGGYGNRLDYLSAEEQRAEQLCEEERYLYLYNNEEEHILQQEEDLKRLTQESGGGYNQVAFQYNNEGNNGDGVGVQHGPNREVILSNSPTCEEQDQAFVMPRNLTVPPSIQLPETMKQHAIIEKTARFIASQGVQMEILLKAKQSNNVQFEFLAQNSVLNPYYKHLVNVIKQGAYPVEEPQKEDAVEKSTNEGNNTFSTAPASTVSTKPIIAVPTIKYKPSANCAYTQLISKIKGVPLPDVLNENANITASEGNSNNLTAKSPLPSDVMNGDNFTPVLLQYEGSTFVTATDDEVSKSNTNKSTSGASAQDKDHSKVEILKNTSALALAQNYSSGSESESEEVNTKTVLKTEEKIVNEEKLDFPIPTENMKNIIDKTASYVIKNGRQFEETLRAKNDERFTFLLHDNEFYPYYMYKITGDPNAASKEEKQRKAAAAAAAVLSKKGLNINKTISPVSFSIKPKDEPPTAGLQPALPQEPSDDEEEKKPNAEISQPRTVPEHVQKAIQLVESQLMARNAQLAVVASSAPLIVHSRSPTSTATATTTAKAINTPYSRNRFDAEYNNATGNSKSQMKSTKAEMERNALFEQQQQNRQKELRKAEEKVKDKLAQIAREKLGGLISKEKQLQLERKRKALAFLNQIRGHSPSSTSPADKNASAEVEKVKIEDENVSNDDSDTSVHSIPITSYGPDEKTDDECNERNIPLISGKTTTPAPPNKTKSIDEMLSSIATATVTVSDDDDVQLISEIKPDSLPRHEHTHRKKKSRKRHSRSRSRSRSHSYSQNCDKSTLPHKRIRQNNSNSSSSSSAATDNSDAEDVCYFANKSRSHKSRPKSKKSSKSRSKKKSKKRSRSRSQSSNLQQHHRGSRSKSQRHSRSPLSHDRHYKQSSKNQHENVRSSSEGSAVASPSSRYRHHAKRKSKHSTHSKDSKKHKYDR